MPNKTECLYSTDQAFFAHSTLPKMKGATLAEHAEQLSETPTHLAHVSRTATVGTAADYLTTRLLRRTQTALVDTKTSAKDIATQLQFDSAA